MCALICVDWNTYIFFINPSSAMLTPGLNGRFHSFPCPISSGYSGISGLTASSLFLSSHHPLLCVYCLPCIL